MKRRAAEFLLTKNPVTIDGQPAEGRLDRIHFIYRTLRSTGVIEPAVELDVNSATLGVVFVYPVDKLPNQASMKWELFSPRIQVVPAVASDEAGGLPSSITTEDPVLIWKNFLTNPTSPQMLTVASPPAPRQFVIPLLSAISVGVLVVMVVVVSRAWRRDQAISRAVCRRHHRVHRHRCHLSAVCTSHRRGPLCEAALHSPLRQPSISLPAYFTTFIGRSITTMKI